jgi:lactoylglutathione lyase
MRWIEVAPRGASTSIALNAAEGTKLEATDTGVRFSVPDAAAEHARMRERGVDVGELLRWDDVPPMFTFDDPDAIVSTWLRSPHDARQDLHSHAA